MLRAKKLPRGARAALLPQRPALARNAGFRYTVTVIAMENLAAKLAALRSEYARAGLSEADVAPTPLAQLEAWLADALSAGLRDANAFTLATASADGTPNARIVLVKGIDARGITFFTHYDSPKGRELAANPRACGVLFWNELERQVRLAGDVEKVTRAESDAYFHSRPRGSQLGALASHQSAPVADRVALDAKLADVTAQHATGTVPLPDNWGGYRLVPRSVEFWQGRPNRMHDRLRYVLGEGGGAGEGGSASATRADAKAWRVERLQP